MKRVLVAGATGYLGGFMVRELKARGHFVRALARSPERLGRLRGVADEIAQGDVTRPESLVGCCDGVDVVFSSVGVTRQRGGLTWRDVDERGNRNLLEVAERAGVERFVYVSILDGPRLRHLEVVDAHETFVDALEASGVAPTVVRPTGFFSDLGEVYAMARRGRVYLIGRGDTRLNPIHGADLAARCADALERGEREVSVGGPETLTWREVAALALRVQGKPVRVTSIPAWTLQLLISVVRPFSRRWAELLDFFTTLATRDMVGPPTGSRTLEPYYRELGATS